MWMRWIWACIAILIASPSYGQTRLDDARAVLEQRNWAKDEAWAVLTEGNLPIIEPHERDLSLARVTFLWRGDPTVSEVRLDSVINAPYAAPVVSNYERDFTLPLSRVAGSDIWSITLDVPRNVQASYVFLVTSAGETLRRSDPANPRRLRGRGSESVLILDQVVDRHLHLPRPDPMEPHHIFLDSEALQREVAIQVYPARGASAATPVLILYDSFLWSRRAPAWEIAEHLVEHGDIPPVHIVLIDEIDTASVDQAYADQAIFIADELLPALAGPIGGYGDVVVAGASRRGLSAVITALSRSEVVAGGLSLSGSFYWAPKGESPEWLARELKPAGPSGPRLYLAVGSLETVHTSANQGSVMLDANRRLADALIGAGYEAELVIYPGGHDVTAWRAALASGMAALWGEGD